MLNTMPLIKPYFLLSCGLQVTIRLGGYARRFAPVRLAASKSFALAVIAMAWLVSIACYDTISGQSIDYWSGWSNPWALLAIVWSALGPGALVAYLQSQVRIADTASLFWQHTCHQGRLLKAPGLAGAVCCVISSKSGHLLKCACMVCSACPENHA